tara:strand:+ start:513 stop:716 length:204 start_codon:yes stop_codon:yes gene_type:complete
MNARAVGLVGISIYRMLVMLRIKWNYIVWVGGCSDYYVYYKDALVAYNDWLSQGYDDVVLEKINEAA